MKMQTSATTAKVKAARKGAGAGGGMGVALAIIIIAVLEANGVQVDPMVEWAAYAVGGGIVAAFVAHKVGYKTRPNIVDKIEAE